MEKKMYIIDKDNIENYRYAIAKECFLRVYSEYNFIEDIEKTNCMIMKRKNANSECIVSLFSKPLCNIKKYKRVYSFYDRNHYRKAVEKTVGTNIQVMEMSETYISEYNRAFEMAIKYPKEYMKDKMEGKGILYKNILLDEKEIEKRNRSWYKYYAQSTIEEQKYGIIDGNISFVDPNTFNDPFDVNCYFANYNDMSNLFRIFCVAPSQKEILMWSYYGTEHKGYCFEYKEQDILRTIMSLKSDGLCIIGEVEYKDNRPNQKSKLNAISLTELKFYVQAAFTKFSEWNHEKEYRYVILSNAFSKDNDQYLTCNIPINNVFRGCKGEKSTIRNSAGKAIQIVQVKKHKNKFEID